MKNNLMLAVLFVLNFLCIGTVHAESGDIRFEDGSYESNDVRIIEKQTTDNLIVFTAINSSKNDRCVSFELLDPTSNFKIIQQTKETKLISTGKTVVGKARITSGKAYFRYRVNAVPCNTTIKTLAYCLVTNEYSRHLLQYSLKANEKKYPNTDWKQILKDKIAVVKKFENLLEKEIAASGVSRDKVEKVVKDAHARISAMLKYNEPSAYKYIPTITAHCNHPNFLVQLRGRWISYTFDSSYKPPLPYSKLNKFYEY